jgi:hypothetical protein
MIPKGEFNSPNLEEPKKERPIRITSARMLTRYYTKKDVKEILDRIESYNDEAMSDLNGNYREMLAILNNFTRIILHIDDEMRFIRNLINFGGNKAKEMDIK